MNNYKTYLIEVTQQCNLRCKYCFFGTYKDRKVGFLDLNRFYELKNKNIWLSGGETFLHPQIKEAIKVFGSNNKLNVFTNGTVISKFQPSLFKNINKLYVSFDSPLKEKNAMYRNSYPDIAYLQKLNETKNTEIVFKKTITKQNYNDLDEYFSEFIALGFKSFSFNVVFIPPGAPLHKELSINESPEISKTIFSTINFWKEKINMDSGYLNTLEKYLAGTLDVSICPALKGEACYIDYKGDISLCPDKRAMELGEKHQEVKSCSDFFNGGCLGMWEVFN